MLWKVYDQIAVLLILSQILFLYQGFRNYYYALKRSRRANNSYQPSVLLTVPCKGIDNAFEKNIASFFTLDYPDYHLCFVVEDAGDAAYAKLNEIKTRLEPESRAATVQILIAGHTTGSSQKIHNLLHSYQNAAPEKTQVLVFADSDACVHAHWLNHLVYPLQRSKTGATTGYRWFIPEKNNLATLALSAMNAKIAQMLGNSRFNQAWGGSMAISREMFEKTNLPQIWKNAISDDLSLSLAVKKAGKKVIFAPACLVASYEFTTWLSLIEFARRQFLITRVTMPWTWFFALFSSFFALFGVWFAGAIAIWAHTIGKPNFALYASIPILFLTTQFIRAVLRQVLICKLLPENTSRLRIAAVADILGNPILSWLMFACILVSAAGRTISWRGIRYRLVSPTKTEKLD